MPKKIQVLIVEDSKSLQMLLAKIISEDSDMEVMDTAENGLEALEILKVKRPDVITMDLLMPGMSGFETIKKIMATKPTPIMVISSKANSDLQQVTFQAIEAGALAVMGKPPGPGDPLFKKISQELTSTLKSLKNANMHRTSVHLRLEGRRIADSTIPIISKERVSKLKAIAIGASLGGPEALKELLSNLSPSYDIPIFIVQHISPGFTKGFAEWLDERSILPIYIPEHGTQAQGGCVYIAPDNFHMTVTKNNMIHLIHEDDAKAIRPSVSKLFQSIAEAHGANAIGILLTGMGRDGSGELLTMRKAGAVTVAQNEASSLSFGMPGTAISLNAAELTLPIGAIAPFLNNIIKQKTQDQLF